MRARPDGVTDADLLAVLAAGWGLADVRLRYTPVGAGSYHWTADRFFVTVDDLDDKPWLGSGRESVLAGLRAALDVALSLAGLPFVLAPIPASTGQCAERLGERYAVTVFPYLDGAAGTWGAYPSARERAEVLDLLAVLHSAAVTGPPRPVSLPGSAALHALLDDPLSAGGPYAAEIRTLLTEAAPVIRGLLADFGRLAVGFDALPKVITHGEPHPGNIIRTGTGPVLIDWDTVGLAPPERDLWFLAEDDASAGFARYQAATDYRPAPAAVELYRLRWRLDDISAYLTSLLRASRPTADTAHALTALHALTR